MTINLSDTLTTTVGVNTGVPLLRTDLVTAHLGTTEQVPTGNNVYVNALLNAGYRWDTAAQTGDSNIIRWNIGAVWNTPLDATSIPPITPAPQWNSALQSETMNAFAAWASVANIHPQFNPTTADITTHIVPLASYDIGFGGYSGTPYEAAGSDITPVLYKNVTVAEHGQVHVYVSDHAAGGAGPVWSLDANGYPSATDAGRELFIHEIGHALGLKHPFDYGTSNDHSLFPGVPVGGQNVVGDNNLNSKLYTLMSYNEADPPASLPFGGAPGGPAVTPMALDIAAIQTLYGANTTTASGNNTYTLSDPGSPAGASWQSIWDTGGIDQIVYNGTANAVIDLRPATLDDSPTGGGMGSYTWNHTAVGHGYTIAGDITNALPDQGGVTGVVIESGIGGSGSDLITGNDANNLLEGNAGDDTISALAGDDIINGGPGNDTLFGGSGNNVFIFEPNSGHDTIMDFDSPGSHDLLDASELGINDLGSLASNVQMAQVGNDAQIHIASSFGISEIDLVAVNVATLNSTDFRFV